jgi:exosortase A
MSVMNNTASVFPSFTWPKAALLTGLVLAALFAIYWPTFHSMVETWERSETFTHGFLIFPISAWLIWGRRHQLARVDPQPDRLGLAVVLMAALGWLVAEAGGVRVVSQYALVTLIVGAVWAILGRRVVKTLAFPLFFLYFAVPMGEFLIPSLMNFTADFTVAALQLTGIPVYREGTFFSIPSGDWSVVEGCSGLRYLIASFTLGTLYAYLTYRSWKRRVIFSAFSLLVPIIANGLRAYMIVMIAHLSDMKLALGVDHYIYGWVFFGIVMLILFWIGSYWREDETDTRPMSVEEAGTVRTHDHLLRYLPMVAAIAALAALAPAYALWLDQRPLPKIASLQVEARNGWQPDSPATDWRAHWIGADRRFEGNYIRAGQRVYLEVAYYATQRQDAELINSQNYFIPQKHPVWSNVGEGNQTASVAGHSTSVRQAKLRSGSQRLLVWQWNVIDGSIVTNDPEAKLRLALSKVVGGMDDGAAIIIATPYSSDISAAERTLTQFAADMAPAINHALGR